MAERDFGQKSSVKLHNFKGSGNMPSFDYYSHAIDSEPSQVWDELLDGMRPLGRVVGVVSQENIIYWSNIGHHGSLVAGATLREEPKTFLGIFAPPVVFETSSIWMNIFPASLGDLDSPRELADYMERNIKKNRQNVSLILGAQRNNAIFKGSLSDYTQQRP